MKRQLIYSMHYSKSGEATCEKQDSELLFEPGTPIVDMTSNMRSRYIVVQKAIDVSKLNRYDLDIYNSDCSLIMDISVDIPGDLTDLRGILSLAVGISITPAENNRSATLTIIYDLDMV